MLGGAESGAAEPSASGGSAAGGLAKGASSGGGVGARGPSGVGEEGRVAWVEVGGDAGREGGALSQKLSKPPKSGMKAWRAHGAPTAPEAGDGEAPGGS